MLPTIIRTNHLPPRIGCIFSSRVITPLACPKTNKRVRTKRVSGREMILINPGARGVLIVQFHLSLFAFTFALVFRDTQEGTKQKQIQHREYEIDTESRES